MDGAVAGTAPPRTLSLGTMFVGPVFDYVLIGGLLSWAAGAVLYFGGYNFPDNDPFLWWAILCRTGRTSRPLPCGSTRGGTP